MKVKILFTIIVNLLLSLSYLYAQNFEKITFDRSDSTDGYYLAIQPQSKNIKGVLVVFSSFTSPENLLPETKLHNVAYANEILTIFVSTKQKLYADSFTVSRINILLKDVAARFIADTSKFVLAGYDEAGNIALRYTELTYENPLLYAVQPKAVFGIDAPVDLFGLWHWSEKQIKKAFWPGAVGDANYYLGVMTKENGTIYTNAAKYKQLSPFYKEDDTTGNERYLQNIPVRLYYDADIEWHLKNRRNSFYDTKVPDGSELIKRLLLAGNKEAELIMSRQPGFRSNGVRSPNALSIVDEVDFIHWIKRSLNIFDAHTWKPPYSLMISAGWTTELFSLPPGFAPQITYKGVEDIRFAPGWEDPKSEEHWTYSFLWWLDGRPAVNAAALQANLKAYYAGLVARNITGRNIPASKIVPTTVAIRKIRTTPNDLETYTGTITMLDYHTAQPMVLNCMIHVKDCKIETRLAIYLELSPQPFAHAVWKKMNQMGQNFECKK